MSRWLARVSCIAAIVLGLAMGVWAAPAPQGSPDASPALGATSAGSATPITGASPAVASSGAPVAASSGAPTRVTGHAQKVGRERNPMFRDADTSVRETIVFATFACFLAIYALFTIGRQLLTSWRDEAAGATGASEAPDAVSPPIDPAADETAEPETAGESAPPLPDSQPAVEAQPADESPTTAPEPPPRTLIDRLDHVSDLQIFGFYLVIAIAVTLPAFFHFGGYVIGDNYSDVWKHVWGMWWVKKWMLGHGYFPLYTPEMNAPYGGALYCIDPLNAIASIPLQLVMSVSAAYNVMIWLQLAFGAYAAFRLSSYLCGSRPCSIPVGVVYAFSPYVMAYPVGSGVSETVNIGWIPFAVLFWLRTVREGGSRNVLGLALCIFLTIFGSFYYGAFLMMLLGVMSVGGIVVWVFGLAHATPEERRQMWTEGRRAALRCTAGAVLGGLMAGLPAYSFFYTVRQPDSIIPTYVAERQDVNFEGMRLISQNYASLVSYFWPGKMQLTSTYTSDRLSRASYIGFVVLLWVLIGLTTRGWARRAFLLALFFMVLSMGPYMVVSPSIHLDHPESPLYLLLASVVPLFSSIAIPYRMALMVSLFLGITLACGLRRVLGEQPIWLQNFLAIAISLQILLEFAVASPAPYPAPLAASTIPAFYSQISAEPGDFSILDLPPTRWNTELTPGEYFLYQTVHGRPIAYTLSGTFYQSLLSNGFTHMLCFPHAKLPSNLPAPTREQARWLSHNHFRYVIVHPSMMTQPDVDRIDALMVEYFGAASRVASVGDDLQVYRIPDEEAVGRPTQPLSKP